MSSLSSELKLQATRERTDLAVGLASLAWGATAVACLELLELLVNRGPFPRSLNFAMILYGEWLWVHAFALVGWTTAPLGQARWLTGLAISVTTWFSVTNFRGVWVWEGTFGHADGSQWAWMAPGLIGLSLGLLLPKGSAEKIQAERRIFVSTAALTAALVMTVFAHTIAPLNSQYAMTRWIALLLGVVMFSLVWMWGNRS